MFNYLNEQLQTLLEFSCPKKAALQTLTGYAKPLASHFCNVYLWPKDEAVNHWIAEIISFLDACIDQRIKPKNKPISNKDLKYYLFDPYMETEREVKNFLKNTMQRGMSKGLPKPEIPQTEFVFKQWMKLFKICTDCKDVYDYNQLKDNIKSFLNMGLTKTE